MASAQSIYQYLWWTFPSTLVKIQAIHHFSHIIDVQFNMYNLLIGIANDATINYGLLLIITMYSSCWSSSKNTFQQTSFCLRICCHIYSRLLTSVVGSSMFFKNFFTWWCIFMYKCACTWVKITSQWVTCLF